MTKITTFCVKSKSAIHPNKPISRDLMNVSTTKGKVSQSIINSVDRVSIDCLIFSSQGGKPSTKTKNGELKHYDSWTEMQKDLFKEHKFYTRKEDATLLFGGTSKDGTRRKSSIINRTIVCIDMEQQAHKKTKVVGPPVPYDLPDQIAHLNQGILAHVYWCMYSTFSHTSTAPRYRLIIPLKEPVEPAYYNELVHRIVDQLGLASYVDACSDRQRRLCFYLQLH